MEPPSQFWGHGEGPTEVNGPITESVILIKWNDKMILEVRIYVFFFIFPDFADEVLMG